MNSDTPQGLRGWRVLVTRPAHQADALCRLIEAQGGTALRLPLMAIEPLAHASAAQQQLRQAQDADAWIFTSPNAVQHALPLLRGLSPPPLAAVGAATAAALDMAGLSVAFQPSHEFSGEALLAHPGFADVQDRRYLVVTGEQGLDVLPLRLRERGAQVQVLPVYRRIALPYVPDQVATLLHSAQAAIVTSGEAVTHLHRLTPAACLPLLCRLPVAVPSARVLERARELGWTGAQALPRMSDNAAVELLVRLRLEAP